MLLLRGEVRAEQLPQLDNARPGPLRTNKRHTKDMHQRTASRTTAPDHTQTCMLLATDRAAVRCVSSLLHDTTTHNNANPRTWKSEQEHWVERRVHERLDAHLNWSGVSCASFVMTAVHRPFLRCVKSKQQQGISSLAQGM